jgi:ribonuclease E
VADHIDPTDTPSEPRAHHLTSETPVSHEAEHSGDDLSPGQIWTPFEEAGTQQLRQPMVEAAPAADPATAESLEGEAATASESGETASSDLAEPLEITDEFAADAPAESHASEGDATEASVDDGAEATSESAAEKPAPRGAKRPTIRPREAPKPRDTIMIVNEAPGDECRVAFVRGKRLESYFAERVASATNVGNIYKGRVTNVEAAIQAAFVDFGEGQNGFLHISDLHPKYFPGGDKAESVGHKIPRRERPAIQDCVRKGQEITVQVIKQGIGTKGPTLTSYLSVPGRLLVMMPDMDKVGVSRKVDDEQQRREMRKILDSLDLPEGFGFILRTAGFDRSRTELQRDAAYLQRLWQAMAKRIDSVGAPAELYTESDILLRTVREMVDETVSHIVVDNEAAWQRVTAFLEVVFAKDAPKVLFYDKPAPIFSAFDLDRQIDSIHSREVPLPSGGALVIDQTEALVAIDVNSGKSRSARDSETNAYNTNKEAVDEICRQLRLRDLGGLVVCDLIDMRMPRHRRDIEARILEHLKKDRAKTTVAPISPFGMIELTRQRMRPSLRKAHYMDCPHCAGSGEVRLPDSTAADGLRQIQLLLSYPQIHRVEMVCGVRVASVILSTRRQQLVEIERDSGKRIDVRISEAIAGDRVDLYAYDDRGADIEIPRLGHPATPQLDELPTEPPEIEDGAAGEFSRDEEEGPRGRRGRRRRRRVLPADATAMLMSGAFDDLPEVLDDEPAVIDEVRAKELEERAAEQESGERTTGGEGDGRESRRFEPRRNRGRGGNRSQGGQPQRSPLQSAGRPDGIAPSDGDGVEGAADRDPDAPPSDQPGGSRRRRGRRGGRRRRGGSGDAGAHGSPAADAGAAGAAPQDGPSDSGGADSEDHHAEHDHGPRDPNAPGGDAPRGRRRRRGRGGRGRGHGGASDAPPRDGSHSSAGDSAGADAPRHHGSSHAEPSGPSGNTPAARPAGDDAKPKVGFLRSLYGAARRGLAPGAAKDAQRKE